MTTEEQNEYSLLSEEQKKEYDYQAEKNPTWDHEKLMVKVGFSEKVDALVESQEDVDVNDKDLMENIIRSVGEWLKRALPRIWEGVKDLFKHILHEIITGAINFFGDILKGFFG